MSEVEPDRPNPGGTVWDWPNQQVVRGGGEGPGVNTPPEGASPVDEPLGLDAMTKDELLAYGQELGISPMNANMTKDEIRAAIDQYEAA